MSIRFEYTKELEGRIARSERIAWSARPDNLLKEQLTPAETRVKAKVLEQIDPFLLFEEFRLLLELAGLSRKFWPQDQQVLRVYFFDGATPRSTKVLSIANEWSNHCGLKFEATLERHQAHIRVSLNEPGSWSYIGTDASGVPQHEATMNFGWLADDLEEQEYRRVVLHEFGHALGLVHEHQRDDAAMRWNKIYVYWYCRMSFGWDRATVDHNIFNAYDQNETNHSTGVDASSIMAYHIPPEFTLDRKQFPLNYELSEMDKQHIGVIYPKRVDMILS